MITIPMTYQTDAGVLLGELTNGMWITSNGVPLYKDTLQSMGVAGLTPYKGSEKIELEDAQYNLLTADYFLTLRRPQGF